MKLPMPVQFILSIPIVLLLLPLAVMAMMVFIFIAVFLYLNVWTWWIRRWSRVIYVYSDSPHWKGHVERQILPALPPDSVVLNWSERSRWPRLSFAVALFTFFGGSYEFNPIGLVFRRFQLVEEFRFWQAFRDFKHGKTAPLEELEASFFEKIAA